MRALRHVAWSFGVLAVLGQGVFAEPEIPAHPREIAYPEFDYEVPPAAQFRAVLPNGMVVYIAEDRLLPTFDMSVTLRVGSAVEPAANAGLAGLMGNQMRDGGTRNLTPEQLDEKLEFLAANIFTRVGETVGSAGLSCLSKDVDEALALFMEVLRYPRFDEDRLRRAKEQQLQNIKRRNDSTDSILAIEWGFLMNGSDHFSNRYSTPTTIQSITRDDLLGLHKRFIHPGNMIIAVAGDFERGAMLKKLERAFADWPAGETGPTTFAAPSHDPKPGVYLIHKDDVNQGRVTIGHRAAMRGTPDEFPLMVMNGILGASGFRSRLVARVRSDEGLAYNTGSQFEQGVYYPGDFRAWFQSRSNACAYATRLVLEEVKGLIDGNVTQADVDDTVNYYAESLPQRFQSKMALLQTYASDEYTGRDPSYWQSFLANLRKVTSADVQRVAKKHLHPDQLVIVAVGDAEAIFAGGHDKDPELKLEAFGSVTRLPLRDPETLKR